MARIRKIKKERTRPLSFGVHINKEKEGGWFPGGTGLQKMLNRGRASHFNWPGSLGELQDPD